MIVMTAEVRRMKILLSSGKEHLDVEIDGKAYRLSGELNANEFAALAHQTALLTQTKTAMSMSERVKLADQSEQLSPKDFTDWLRNQDAPITTNLQALSESEKNRVMHTVCNEWPDETLSICFYDENFNLLCKSKRRSQDT
jgi:hypothetical protein